jgi:hypothetical protein
MRSLSGALSAALAAPVQRPAVLVEIGFDPVRRWSSHGTVAWNGHTWEAADIRVEGLQVEPLRIAGAIVLGNADGVAGALVLAQGVADRAVTVWGYDAGATGAADVVGLGIGGAAVSATADVTTDEVRIAIRHRAEFTFSPRATVGAAAGITTLLPAGAVVRINGLDYRLERRG